MENYTTSQAQLLKNIKDHILENNDGDYEEVVMNTISSFRDLMDSDGTTGDDDLDDLLNNYEDNDLIDSVMEDDGSDPKESTEDETKENETAKINDPIMEEEDDEEENKEEETDRVYTNDVEEFKKGGKTKKKTFMDISFIFDKALK